MAARAGKDVYSEKPCGMTIGHCQALDDTMRQCGRVFQAGTQRRSIGNFRFAVDLARRGTGLEYLDIGGGLGVDYDGSQTNFESRP